MFLGYCLPVGEYLDGTEFTNKELIPPIQTVPIFEIKNMIFHFTFNLTTIIAGISGVVIGAFLHYWLNNKIFDRTTKLQNEIRWKQSFSRYRTKFHNTCLSANALKEFIRHYESGNMNLERFKKKFEEAAEVLIEDLDTFQPGLIEIFDFIPEKKQKYVYQLHQCKQYLIQDLKLSQDNLLESELFDDQKLLSLHIRLTWNALNGIRPK